MTNCCSVVHLPKQNIISMTCFYTTRVKLRTSTLSQLKRTAWNLFVGNQNSVAKNSEMFLRQQAASSLPFYVRLNTCMLIVLMMFSFSLRPCKWTARRHGHLGQVRGRKSGMMFVHVSLFIFGNVRIGVRTVLLHIKLYFPHRLLREPWRLSRTTTTQTTAPGWCYKCTW